MGLKRVIYGLPALAGYRNARTRALSRRHRPHHGGFAFAGAASQFDPDHEREERDCLSAEMARADVFIDVGANQGLYSCIAAARGLQVAAVEPEAGNLRFLTSNVARNGFAVEIFATALGERAGVQPIYGDGDTASLVMDWASSARAFSAMTPVNALDNLFADRWPAQRILVKMDVEGFELAVLTGAPRLLARAPRPVWLIETFPRMYTAARSDNPEFGAVFDVMFGHGYGCRHAQTGHAVDRAQVNRWIAGEDAASLGRGNFLFA